MIVYRLCHVRPCDDGHDSEKLIGIYSSRQKAMDAMRRLVGKPGFRDCPTGFEIHDIELDVDSWTEGYINAKDA